MNILTQEGKVVMCKIISVKDFGYECQLLENWGYDLEGELLFTEITRKKRLRCKPEKLLSIGKTLPLRIIDVGDDLISLTKMQIDTQEIEECEEKYEKYRTLDSILHSIAYIMQKDLEELYINIARPLIQKEKTPLDILIESLDENFSDLNYDSNIKEKLKEDIKTRVLNKKVKLQQIIKLTCFEPNGINIIKNALKEGQQNGLTIYLDSVPDYVISMETRQQEFGKQLIEKSIQNIKDYIIKNNGQIQIDVLKVIE